MFATIGTFWQIAKTQTEWEKLLDIAPQEAREAKIKAVQVLLYHTLLVSESEFMCGNCGDNAKPHFQIRCPTCGVRWIFSAATYEPPLSLAEQAQAMKTLLPSSFTFIGYMDALGVHEAYLPLSMF